MRSIGWIITGGLLLSMMPVAEAQTYTPLTASEWSAFVNRCLEFIEWVHSMHDIDGPAHIDATASSPFTPTGAPTIDAGPVCGIGIEDHFHSPTASLNPVTPVTDQVKIVDYCATSSTWYGSPDPCATDSSTGTASRVRTITCYQSASAACQTGSTTRAVTFAAEYSASWAPATSGTASTTCGWSTFENLPITPAHEFLGTVNANCNSADEANLLLAVWTSAQLTKATRTNVEDGIPEFSLNTDDWTKSCSTADTASSGSFLINDRIPSGFLYYVVAERDADLGDGLTASDAVLTVSTSLLNPVIVESGTAIQSGNHYSWSIYRLGFNSRSVNDTTSLSFTVTVTETPADSDPDNQICWPTPRLSEAAPAVTTTYNNRFTSLRAQSIASTIDWGVLTTWSYPSFISNVRWFVNDTDGNPLSLVTVRIEGVTGGATSCTTASDGSCTTANIIDQSVTVYLSREGSLDASPISVILGGVCNGVGCGVGVVYDTSGDDTIVTPGTVTVTVDKPECTEFPIGVQFDVNLTRNANLPLQAALFRSNGVGQYIIADGPVQWTVAMGSSFNYVYPGGRNLQSGDADPYILAVASTEGVVIVTFRYGLAGADCPPLLGSSIIQDLEEQFRARPPPSPVVAPQQTAADNFASTIAWLFGTFLGLPVWAWWSLLLLLIAAGARFGFGGNPGG